MSVALKGVNLIDGVSDEPKMQVTLLLEGERIAAVLPAGAAVPKGTQEFALDGCWVLPGLVNLHAHLFGSGKPSKTLSGGYQQKLLLGLIHSPLGKPVLDKLVAGNVRAALLSGVTTLRSVGDFRYSDVRVRDAVAAGRLPGPRMLVSGPAITPPGGHGDGTFAMTATTPADFAACVRKNAAEKVDLIKICVTGGVMDATESGEPGALKMTPEQTKAACDEAHRLGYKVASHTESAEGVRVALENGVDTIEHGSLLDPTLLELFKQRGAAYVCTISPALPIAQLPGELTCMPPIAAENGKVVLRGIIEGSRAALAAGIPVGLGTDASCPFVAQTDMWRELVYFRRYVGASAMETIRCATSSGARILGIQNETGSIEEGKCADLLVVAGDPLADLRVLRSPRMVVCRGRCIENPAPPKNPALEAALEGLL